MKGVRRVLDELQIVIDGAKATARSDENRESGATSAGNAPAYIRFTSPVKTRQERTGQVRVKELAGSDEEMQRFLVSVLGAYAMQGEGELSLKKLGGALTARHGTIADAKAKLGGLPKIKRPFLAIQDELYSA